MIRDIEVASDIFASDMEVAMVTDILGTWPTVAHFSLGHDFGCWGRSRWPFASGKLRF